MNFFSVPQCWNLQNSKPPDEIPRGSTKWNDPPLAAITPQFARRSAGALIVVIWVLIKPLNRKHRRLIRRSRAKPPQNCSLFNGFSRKDSKETIGLASIQAELKLPLKYSPFGSDTEKTLFGSEPPGCFLLLSLSSLFYILLYSFLPLDCHLYRFRPDRLWGNQDISDIQDIRYLEICDIRNEKRSMSGFIRVPVYSL